MQVLTRVFFFTVSVTLTFLTQSRPLLLHTPIPRETGEQGPLPLFDMQLIRRKTINRRFLKQVKGQNITYQEDFLSSDTN